MNRKIQLNQLKTACVTQRVTLHRDHLLEITDINGDIAYASDLKTAAQALKCTIGAISNAASGKLKTVKGCTVRWVDSTTLKAI